MNVSVHKHLHSRINFIPPYQRHYDLGENIMEKRIETYEKAREKHPERWTNGIRDWSLPNYVTLNPIDEKEFNKYILERNN